MPGIVVTKQAAGHWSWICTEHHVGSVSAVGALASSLDAAIAQHLWRHGKPVPLW